MVAQVLPPPSLPANRLFFLVIAWGLIARSTMLESISTRPSVRKRSKMSRREMAYRSASASFDLPETRGRVACQRVKRSRTIAAEDFLTRRDTSLRVLAPDGLLDLPELRHALDRRL